jgi:hypothetical protein
VNGPADAAFQPLCLGVELAGNLVVTFAALDDHEVLEQAGRGTRRTNAL